MANRYLITGGSSVVWTAADTSLWSTASGGATGASVPVDGDAVIFDGSSGGGTVTLGYSPTVTSITMGAFTGTFTVGANNPTMQSFNCSNTGTRTLNMGSGTWSITGNNATVWDISVTTGLTQNIETSTVNFTYAGSTGTRNITGTLVKFYDLGITAGSDSITFATAPSFHNLSFAGFTGNWGNATATPNISGNLILGTGMTCTTGSGTLTFSSTTSQTITTNGVQINHPITFNGVGGSWTLQDSLNMDGASVRTLTLTNGTFNANGYNVTCGNFSSSNSNTRTITMGSGTWTLTGTGNVWNTNTAAGLTFSGASSTIVITDTSASSKTFIGASASTVFGTLTIPAGGSGQIIMGATNKTFATINIAGPKTVSWNNGTTYTVTNLNITGSAGNLVTFVSATPGSQYTLSVASGDVYARYVSLQDSNATGGARFFALNSTNVSNNTGWNFVASRTAASGRFNVRDQHAAISLDGSTSFLVKASPTGINNGTNGSVTISAWVRLDQTDLCTVAELHVNGGTSPSFGIGQSGGQYVVFSDRVNGGNNKVIAKATFDTYIGLNRWVMLTYVLTSANITIYAGTTAILPTSSFGTAINAGTISNLFIGKGQTVGQADIQFLKGGVKDVRIYNAALTATEVSNLYYSQINPTTPAAAWEMDEGAGASIVTSVGSNNLTATGITWTADRPFAARKRDDGNLVKNGDFEYAPPFVAITTGSAVWLDGTAAGSATNTLFNWYKINGAGAYAASFDSSTTFQGKPSIKMESTNSTGRGRLLTAPTETSTTAAIIAQYGIPVLASTSYTLTANVKTAGVDTAAVRLIWLFYQADGTQSGGGTGANQATTQDFTPVSQAFTTGASTAYVVIKLDDNTATANVRQAWFNKVRLTATTPQVRAAASGRVAIS